jgi:hypothetical protein
MVTRGAAARRAGVKAERGASKLGPDCSKFSGQTPSGCFAQARPILM